MNARTHTSHRILGIFAPHSKTARQASLPTDRTAQPSHGVQQQQQRRRQRARLGHLRRARPPHAQPVCVDGANFIGVCGSLGWGPHALRCMHSVALKLLTVPSFHPPIPNRTGPAQVLPDRRGPEEAPPGARDGAAGFDGAGFQAAARAAQGRACGF